MHFVLLFAFFLPFFFKSISFFIVCFFVENLKMKGKFQKKTRITPPTHNLCCIVSFACFFTKLISAFIAYIFSRILICLPIFCTFFKKFKFFSTKNLRIGKKEIKMCYFCSCVIFFNFCFFCMNLETEILENIFL